MTVSDQRDTAVIIAVLVKRLGGDVEISPSEISEVAYRRLIEERVVDGSVKFKLADS